MAPPLEGESLWSKLLDLFVICHCAVAFLFASAMLIAPGCFKLFVESPDDFNSLAEDSVRWASPFVFGFSGLAAQSLYMAPDSRRYVALLYTGCFLLATCIGSWVQTTGRWNDYHPLNIVLFASLAAVYGPMAAFVPHAFSRGEDRHAHKAGQGNEGSQLM